MTLLEALVTVAIVALISAIGYPMIIAAEPALRLRAESHALIADLRRARAAAIHLGRPIALSPDPDGGGWRWDGGAERLGGHDRLSAQGPVRFFADGSATGGTLLLASPGRSARIEVEGVTGRAAIVR